ncbi:hypothetical protein ABZS29_33925 [Kribbella sp. NPDC005582]|uniref:hypothetical protein n=1 Tax=Kribbella sp. NPDC005582 TaxID=3156893 RepID=UPI0033A07D6A
MTTSGTLAVGYLRQYPAMTHCELARAKAQIAAAAQECGFVLRHVFVEEMATDPAAFDALIKVARRRKVAAVIVLAHVHLSAVGDGETKLQRLHRETGAHALIVGGSTP